MINSNIKFFVLIFLLSIPAVAEIQQQGFIHYFDCLRSKVKPLDVKVFLKVQGDSNELQKPLAGSKYTQGIDIDLILDNNRKIVGFKMQDIDNVITVDQLKRGLQFGVLNKTFHTIELNKLFDPEKGGQLIMGTLSETSLIATAKTYFDKNMEKDSDLRRAQQDFPELGLSAKLKKHYNESKKKNPTLWIEETFDIVNQNGTWKLFNSKKQEANTIFVEMKIPSPYLPTVLGLDKVQSVFIDKHAPCTYLKPEHYLLSNTERETVLKILASGKEDPKVGCRRN